MIIMNVFCNHPNIGRFSQLIIPNSNINIITVEQFYKDNIPFKSSVPLGEYDLVEYDSPKYGDTVALSNPDLNVYVNEADRESEDDRYACLYHRANRFDQLMGCIAAGLDFGWIPLTNKSPILGVKKSKMAMLELLPHLKKEKKLKIQMSDDLNQNLYL